MTEVTNRLGSNRSFAEQGPKRPVDHPDWSFDRSRTDQGPGTTANSKDEMVFPLMSTIQSASVRYLSIGSTGKHTLQKRDQAGIHVE